MPAIGIGISTAFNPFSLPYGNKVLSTENANLIGYWPMWEPSGAVADNYEGTAARDGAYTGVTLAQTGIGDGRTCPLFDGTNDFCDIYSVSFRDALNGAAGTAAIWVKAVAGLWTDGATDMALVMRVDANNRIELSNNANNTILWLYRAGGTSESISKAGLSTTSWVHIAITWDKTANAMKAYWNGIQEGATQTIAGIWAGTLDASRTVVGASSTGPTGPWDGNLAHCAVWTKALSDAQILALATV
jgi:hypothetical protein